MSCCRPASQCASHAAPVENLILALAIGAITPRSSSWSGPTSGCGATSRTAHSEAPRPSATAAAMAATRNAVRCAMWRAHRTTKLIPCLSQPSPDRARTPNRTPNRHSPRVNRAILWSMIAGAIARLRRWASLPPRELAGRLGRRAADAISWKRAVRRIAFRLESWSVRVFDAPYVEREAPGPVNIQVKLARQAAGGPFEPPQILLINRAAAALASGARRVVEIGCGTGMFAAELVARDENVHVTASEFDAETFRWTVAHRAHPRITYCQESIDGFSGDRPDLVVALEVVEHVKDYPGFLYGLTRVADRALLSTPNKNRSAFASVAPSPAFSEHVREWTAGEFYWVLSVFWKDVQMYTVPDFRRQSARLRDRPDYQPAVRRCSVLEREEPLLALCSGARRFVDHS